MAPLAGAGSTDPQREADRDFAGGVSLLLAGIGESFPQR